MDINEPGASTHHFGNIKKKIRKVRSLGGGWLQRSTSGTRRQRAGTLDSEISDTTGPYRDQETSSEVEGSRDSNAAFNERRGTVAIAEGAAKRIDERGRRKRPDSEITPHSYGGAANTAAVQEVLRGGDAPLPDPKVVRSERDDEE